MPTRSMKKFLTIASIFVLATAVPAAAQDRTKEAVGTGLGALIGGFLGNVLGDKNKTLLTAIGAAAGGFLGNRIGQYLDEQDRLNMAKATENAALTGKTQSWSNPDTKVSGTARVVSTKTTQEQVKVPVLKDKVTKVPPLEIIGQIYRAKNQSNLRGGPGTDYVKVGELAAGETFNVVGKVKDQPWLLVSHDGVGSGFVSDQLVEPAPTEKAATTVAVDKSNVVDADVTASKLCRTVEQSVTLTDGKTESETIEACQSPSGWERKA